MKQLLQSVPKSVKVLLMLIGIGVLIGKDWVSLPTTVTALQENDAEILRHVEDIDLAIARIDLQYTRVICLLTLTEEVRERAASNPVVLERECR